MGKDTSIEWADDTFNPWVGCTKVSSGCKNCYAEELMDKRMSRVSWGKGNARSKTAENNWKKPLQWQKQAQRTGTRRKVFCSSLADVFDAEVPQAWRNQLWDLIKQTPDLDWLLLTKRPENIRLMAPIEWFEGSWPDNVWAGCTVEEQAVVQGRLSALLDCPAPVRFLSCEPLLGPLDLAHWLRGDCPDLGEQNYCSTCDDLGDVCDRNIAIDWVICGGESGKNARPMHPDWARKIRDQCARNHVPFFFKQWGEYRPATQEDIREHSVFARTIALTRSGRVKEDRECFDPAVGDCLMLRAGKNNAGRLLDRVEWNGKPKRNLYRKPR